jgi:hypothetical protein
MIAWGRDKLKKFTNEYYDNKKCIANNRIWKIIFSIDNQNVKIKWVASI